jgi:hypothetical protein
LVFSRVFNEVPEDLGTRPQLHQSRRSQSPPYLKKGIRITLQVKQALP